MTARLGRAVAAGLVVLTAVLAPTAASAQDPRLGLGAGTVEPGQQLLVRGQGWAPGAQVNLQICGANGQRGSSGCAVEQSRQAVAGDDGTFVEVLDVEIPRLPCPCVVLGTDGVSSTTAPLTIVGAPTDTGGLAAPSGSARGLELLGFELRGHGPWTAWFGASPQRTAVATVHNPGADVVEGAELLLTVTSGGEAPTIIGVDELEPLAPGGTITVERGVGLGGLAFGSYTVRAELTGAGAPVSASASASSYPWGLIVLAILAVQAGLLAVRDRLRRRANREPVAPTGVGDEQIGGAVPAVLDLTDPVEVRDDRPGVAASGLPAASVADAMSALLDAAGREIDQIVTGAAERLEQATLRAEQDHLLADQLRATLHEHLRAAQAETDALVERAEAAAAELHALATADRQAAAVELDGLRRDRQLLVDAGERAVRAVGEMAGSGGAGAGDAGPVRGAPAEAGLPDGIDRRLADAIVRALGSP